MVLKKFPSGLLVLFCFFLLCRAKRKGESAWEDKYKQLVAYQQVHGHCTYDREAYIQNHTFLLNLLSNCLLWSFFWSWCVGNVPTKHKENRALGRWVSTQRSAYKRMLVGEECCMTQERVERLNELGFSWSMVPSLALDEAANSDTQGDESIQQQKLKAEAP